MTTANLQVRRASVDDLPQLISLWQQEQLPSSTLEKRFKDFQVVEGANKVLGAIGLEVAGTEGRLHSEVFAHPEQADALRGMLWERMQVVGKNVGLVRIWTQLSTPFWSRTRLEYAPDGVLSKLPGAIAGDPRPWRVLQLKDELSPAVAAEREFEVYRQMEKHRQAQIQERAKVLKIIASVVVMVVCGLLVFWVLAFFKARARLVR
jgi:hypothetical protein